MKLEILAEILALASKESSVQSAKFGEILTLTPTYLIVEWMIDVPHVIKSIDYAKCHQHRQSNKHVSWQSKIIFSYTQRVGMKAS